MAVKAMLSPGLAEALEASTVMVVNSTLDDAAGTVTETALEVLVA